MIVLLFLYLTIRAFAQIPPGDHTIGTANPTFSVLDCSARDVLTSQLASCLVSQDAAKPNYPEDCQTLVWIQGLLTTCTSGPAVTATTAADREEVEEDFMGEAESETTLSTFLRRSEAAPEILPPVYLEPTTTTQDEPTTTADSFDPHLATGVTPFPGYPLPTCAGM
jgi:hypothetical protein